MKMPTESSAELQMVRSMPSHVGSCVLVIAFSSMVLKMEHTVPLIAHLLALLEIGLGWDMGDSHDTKQEHNAEPPLRSLRQLHLRQIHDRGDRIHDIRQDVADTLQVTQWQRPFRPAFPHCPSIPICAQRGASEECEHRHEEVENGDHEDRRPDYPAVEFRKVKYKEVRTNRPLEHRHGNDVQDLRDPEDVRVPHDVCQSY
jgi:hypothetical protein